MSHRARTAALMVAALMAAPADAQPGGGMTLTRAGGVVDYGQNNAPTSETSVGPQTVFFSPASGVNQVGDNWWFYRVQGDTRERPFGTYTKSDGFTITGTSNWPPNNNGQAASYAWTENGASGPRFTATYDLALSGGPTAYDARLDQTFQITNPNPTPLTISLYDLVAWVPNDNFSAQLTASGNANTISVTDGTYVDTHTAVGATAFQAGSGPALANLLTNSSPDDLNNTGLPYSGMPYFADAFEWTLTIPGDGAQSVESSLITAHAVPEPNPLFLVGPVAAVLAIARRRRYLGAEGRITVRRALSTGRERFPPVALLK